MLEKTDFLGKFSLKVERNRKTQKGTNRCRTELKEEIRKKRFEPEPSAANHTTGNNPNRNNSLLQKLIQLDNLLSSLFTDKTK